MSKSAHKYCQFHKVLQGFRPYINGKPVDKASLFHYLPETSVDLIIGAKSACYGHLGLKSSELYKTRPLNKAKGVLSSVEQEELDQDLVQWGKENYDKGKLNRVPLPKNVVIVAKKRRGEL
jgi:hypothetical protein